MDIISLWPEENCVLVIGGVDTSIGSTIAHDLLTNMTPGVIDIFSWPANADLDALVSRLEKIKSLRLVVICTEEPPRDAAWEDTIESCLTRPTRYAEAVLPLLISGSGDLIFIGSRLARSAGIGAAPAAVAAAKGLLGFATSIGKRVRARGVRVTCINASRAVPALDIAAAVRFAASANDSPSKLTRNTIVSSVDLSGRQRGRHGAAPLVMATTTTQGRSQRRCALVTGGSRGIGRSVALDLARRGWNIAILGRNRDALAESAALLRNAVAMGTSSVAPPIIILPLQVDVTDLERLRGAFRDAAHAFGGRLDAVISSAGINRRRSALSGAPFIAADPAIWKRLIDVNLCAAMAVAAEALPLLARCAASEDAGSAALVFISSHVVRYEGTAGQSSYAASKHGLNAFAASVAKDVAPLGLDLKIACVNPALVSTELGRRPTSEEGLTALSAALQIPPSDIGVAVNYIIESPPSSTPVTIDLINVAPGFSAKL